MPTLSHHLVAEYLHHSLQLAEGHGVVSHWQRMGWEVNSHPTFSNKLAGFKRGYGCAGITLNYFLRRLGIFFLTIWIAGTIIWLIPHLAPGDPISAMVARMSSRAGFVENSAEIIEGWKERFGLNDPLPVQYVRYLGNLVHLDFGYSMANFPNPC